MDSAKVDMMLSQFAGKVINQGLSTPYIHLDGYMDRFWVTPNPKDDDLYEQTASARLHHILRADTDLYMHDHPFDSVTLILAGGYVEIVPHDQKQDMLLDSTHWTSHIRQPGDIIFRKATDRHKIISIAPDPYESWSLFMTGPWRQDWGFYTPEGKVYWREYLNEWGADPAPGTSVGARP